MSGTACERLIKKQSIAPVLAQLLITFKISQCIASKLRILAGSCDVRTNDKWDVTKTDEG